MASEKVPYCLPTAPSVQYYDPQSIAYPPASFPPLPQQYSMQDTAPPPYQFDTSGPVSYGFNCPPPYSPATSSGYYPGYPTGGISTSQPCIPLAGQQMYPDLSQLPSSSEVQATYSSSNSPLSPARPAPVPPCQTFKNTPASVSSDKKKFLFAHLKEGEAPSGYVVQWRGDGLQIFFLQREGHIVSPQKPLTMSIYKQIAGGVPGSMEGMVELHGVWRLRLAGKATPVLHATDCYIFHDNSTCPDRMVIVQMLSQLSKKMSSDLLDLLTDLTDLRTEDGGMVEKVTSGVATVYGDVTQKLNTVVKETVPSAHKNTKWLRKGTGSLVKMGGNLVAKGIHLVADHIPANEKQQEESEVHAELLMALKKYKNALETNGITFV